MNIDIAGNAYKSHPLTGQDKIPYDIVPIKVTDFALNEMIELPFKILSIHLQSESKKHPIEDYLKYIEVFGRIFQIIHFEKLKDGIYKVQIVIDTSERPLGRIKATYNEAQRRFELVYPYRYPMPNPAAYRPTNAKNNIVPLSREGETESFSLKYDAPTDLADGEEVEIFVNWDPSVRGSKK